MSMRQKLQEKRLLSDRIYEFDKEKRQLCQVPESREKEKEMER